MFWAPLVSSSLGSGVCQTIVMVSPLQLFVIHFGVAFVFHISSQAAMDEINSTVLQGSSVPQAFGGCNLTMADSFSERDDVTCTETSKAVELVRQFFLHDISFVAQTKPYLVMHMHTMNLKYIWNVPFISLKYS